MTINHNVGDDDFVPLFLLLSCQHPSILALLLQAKLKHFLSLEELRKRDWRIPHCRQVSSSVSSLFSLFRQWEDCQVKESQCIEGKA